jgi:hypothetical protein
MFGSVVSPLLLHQESKRKMATSNSTPSTPTFVQITSYSINPNQGNVEYTIQIGKKGDTVRRRFREFLKLRDQMLPFWEDAPPLPSRFFDTAPQSRLPLLNYYLSEVCETLGAKPPKPLLQFLKVDEERFADARAAVFDKRPEATLKVDIGKPKVAEQFRDTIERTLKEVLETAEAVDGIKGWKIVGQQVPFTWMARAEDKEKGVKANRVAYGELKRCPPRLVHDLMLDNNACMQMEPKIDYIKDIERLDEHTFVQFFVMKSIMFMPQRDVILVRHWRVLPDNSIVHAEFSVEEYPGVPKSGEDGRVRARLTVGGVLIKPVPGDPTSCRIWRVNDMDPRLGDAIPAYALAKLNEFTASMLSNNMFSLAKLIGKSNLSHELAKGPLINCTGNVVGISTVNVAGGPNEDGKKRVEGATFVDEFGPYVVGFAVGFLAAFGAFTAIAQS